MTENRSVVAAVAVLAMAALFYAIVGDAGCGPPPARDAGVLPDAAVFVKPTPLPPFEMPKLDADAAIILDEDTITREDVDRLGLIGRYPKWVGELLGNENHWKPVRTSDEAEVWRNGNDVEVTFRIEKGRVAQMSATFPETSFSADLTAVSWLVVGNRTPLPLHWEEFEPHDGEPRSGSFDTDDGRRYYYRGRVRTEGQDPYGPERFEIRATPFRD